MTSSKSSTPSMGVCELRVVQYIQCSPLSSLVTYIARCGHRHRGIHVFRCSRCPLGFGDCAVSVLTLSCPLRPSCSAFSTHNRIVVRVCFAFSGTWSKAGFPARRTLLISEMAFLLLSMCSSTWEQMTPSKEPSANLWRVGWLVQCTERTLQTGRPLTAFCRKPTNEGSNVVQGVFIDVLSVFGRPVQLGRQE